MFGIEPDMGMIEADSVRKELTEQTKDCVHYTNSSEIIKLLEAITDLVKDGTEHTIDLYNIKEQLKSTTQILNFAQEFIKSKGLAAEFNQYCYERDKQRR